nr:hypothetical protein GCM10020185_83150 [Pseudomonas brassicacearum subsp. brassicacearum]
MSGKKHCAQIDSEFGDKKIICFEGWLDEFSNYFFGLSEDDNSMRLIYRLEHDLERDHERVSLTQALTLDKNSPAYRA